MSYLFYKTKNDLMFTDENLNINSIYDFAVYVNDIQSDYYMKITELYKTEAYNIYNSISKGFTYTQENFFVSFISKLINFISGFFNAIRTLIKKVINWVKKIFSSSDDSDASGGSSGLGGSGISSNKELKYPKDAKYNYIYYRFINAINTINDDQNTLSEAMMFLLEEIEKASDLVRKKDDSNLNALYDKYKDKQNVWDIDKFKKISSFKDEKIKQNDFFKTLIDLSKNKLDDKNRPIPIEVSRDEYIKQMESDKKELNKVSDLYIKLDREYNNIDKKIVSKLDNIKNNLSNIENKIPCINKLFGLFNQTRTIFTKYIQFAIVTINHNILIFKTKCNYHVTNSPTPEEMDKREKEKDNKENNKKDKSKENKKDSMSDDDFDEFDKQMSDPDSTFKL